MIIYTGKDYQDVSRKAANIMSAKKILLVATGTSKAEALYNSLYGPITPKVPASILQLHPDLTVVADEDALSMIREKIK